MSVFKLVNITNSDITVELDGDEKVFPPNQPVDLVDKNSSGLPNINLMPEDFIGCQGGQEYETIIKLVREDKFLVSDGDKTLIKNLSVDLLKYGERPMYTNPLDGRMEIRQGVTDIGWHQQFDHATFETSTGNYHAKHYNEPCTDWYTEINDENGNILGNGVNTAEAVEPNDVQNQATSTSFIFQPTFEYDLIAGNIYVPSSLPDGNWYIFTTALPDFDANGTHKSLQVAPGVHFNALDHGGVPNVRNVPYIVNYDVNFMLGNVAKFTGKSTKKFPYVNHPQLGNLGFNKIEIKLFHPKGAKARFQIQLEFYKSPV